VLPGLLFNPAKLDPLRAPHFAESRTGPGRGVKRQNGHTNRVPCAFAFFHCHGHPGLHNRTDCTGGAATNRAAGFTGFAGRAGRTDFRVRVIRLAAYVFSSFLLRS